MKEKSKTDLKPKKLLKSGKLSKRILKTKKSKVRAEPGKKTKKSEVPQNEPGKIMKILFGLIAEK